MKEKLEFRIENDIVVIRCGIHYVFSLAGTSQVALKDWPTACKEEGLEFSNLKKEPQRYFLEALNIHPPILLTVAQHKQKTGIVAYSLKNRETTDLISKVAKITQFRIDRPNEEDIRLCLDETTQSLSAYETIDSLSKALQITPEQAFGYIRYTIHLKTNKGLSEIESKKIARKAYSISSIPLILRN